MLNICLIGTFVCFSISAQSVAQACGAPSLNDGYFVPVQVTYSHETNLTYACRNGHKPAVEGWWATSTCQNGRWSHEPQCIGKCPINISVLFEGALKPLNLRWS